MPRHLVILLVVFASLFYSACNRQQQLRPTPPEPVPTAYPNVRIDIASSDNPYGPCEPSIAINPLNPDQLVAGAILDRVYYSSDGGQTWQKQQITSPYGVFGDPVILADYAGNFYYAHLSDPTGGKWRDAEILDRIVVQQSGDGGQTWNDGGYAGFHHPKDQDKQWLAVNPQNNHLYMSWTEFDAYGSSNPNDHSRILFAASTDAGKNWSPALSISQKEGDCRDDDQTTEGAVPAVGPQGEIYVAWAHDEKIFFDRSLDGGKTWLDSDRLVATQPGGWTFDIPGISRCNGLPVTATDLSQGPHRGTIYVNWSDQRNGTNDTDIWLSYSSDGGETWSAPSRVNDDSPGRHQFLSWLTVDPTTGIVYIVYYDRRNYTDLQTDVYLAWSKDGGKTFENQRISEQPFAPNKAAFFGDYNHISAVNGKVRPIWTRADGTRLSVWTALIEMP